MIKDDPVIFLKGKQELLDFLNNNSNQSMFDEILTDKFKIESDFIIECINEVKNNNQYPYNATIYDLVNEKLNLGYEDGYSDNANSKLKTLVYNAQNYKRSNELKQAGFLFLTQEMIDQAYTENKKIETNKGLVCKVEKIDGKNYAKIPKKHMKVLIACGNVTIARII